jgi:hypothetical protein
MFRDVQEPRGALRRVLKLKTYSLKK